VNPDGQEACLQCQTPLPRIKIEAVASQPPRPPGPVASQFRRGQVVTNRYTVLNIIGRGGMGTIYRVHDNTLGEDVALKTLLPQFAQDKQIIERFFNEARIARKLAHPNIVRVHDIGIAGDVLYISMEHIEGKSLRGLLESLPPGQRLPIKQVLHIFDELCAALEYAHQYTVHRDIKPENVMITTGGTVKLMDFGISKLMANTRLTGASIVMGTPFYMSPEQLRNSRDVDACADLYSVGVMLYEVLTGNMPTGVPKPASEMIKDLPRELDAIVAKCVQPDPKDRYQNASELRGDLLPLRQLILAGGDTTPVMRSQSRSRSWPMRKIAGWLMAALLIAGVAGSYVELENRREALLSQTAGAETTASSGQEALTGEATPLPELIEQVRTRAELRAATLEPVRAICREAAVLWAAARDAEGNAASAEAQRAALRAYVAAILWRDGMVFIPGGTVNLGETPVDVPAFLIDHAEVTAGQFAAFCQDVPGGWRFPNEFSDLAEDELDLPISMVSFYDAQAFAARADKLLPTEAQWARAACGYPDSAPQTFPWGEEWKAGGANTGGAYGQSAKIKSFDQDHTLSACWDMAGNVSEWTRTTARTDAGDPDFGIEMLVRGGNFASDPSPLTQSSAMPFEQRAHTLGFRCVLELPTAPQEVAECLKKSL
jgi:hypothetical protein